MSQTCIALGLGVAFVATLLLNVFDGEASVLPLWQKAAYCLAGGLGMFLVARIMDAREQRAVHAARKPSHEPDR